MAADSPQEGAVYTVRPVSRPGFQPAAGQEIHTGSLNFFVFVFASGQHIVHW